MRAHCIRAALPFLAILAACACSKNDTSSGQAATPASATPSPSAQASASAATPTSPSAAMLRGPMRGAGHGGIDARFFRAAGDLTLSDDQRAKLDTLQTGLHDGETGPRDAIKAFNADLATQVRAGKIDASKLQADEASFDAAMSTAHDKQSTALDGLHALLDASQRKALVDAVRAKMAEHDKRASEGKTTYLGKRRLDRMTKDLDLDASQQAQLGAVMAKQTSPAAVQSLHDAVKAGMDALLAAFASDTFDAHKAVPVTLGGKTPHDAMDHAVALMTQLVPTLHPNQRDKLATSLELRRVGPGSGPSDDEGEHGGGGDESGGDHAE